MSYKAAIIGCHGVGKTTLVKKLENKGFKVFHEAPLNNFMGNNAFLSEVKLLLDNMIINSNIKNSNDKVISDRFAFLDVLLYSEGFFKLGWINEEQLKHIYNLVNHSKHDWVFPEKIICLTGNREEILHNIKIRNREAKFKELEEIYLNTIMQVYEEFYAGKLELKGLNFELRERVKNTPKFLIHFLESFGKSMELLNQDRLDK